MNKYKVGNVICTLLSYGLTFGGAAGVIIYNYVDPSNSSSFKISITGIILVIALLYTAKGIFEHSYQKSMNSLLQQLGTTMDPNVKDVINDKINKLEVGNQIYVELTRLLPFAILYAVTFLGAVALQELHGTLGMVLASMGAGSVFDVARIPLKKKASSIKFENKAAKKVKKNNGK